jgi:hypothetical protein
MEDLQSRPVQSWEEVWACRAPGLMGSCHMAIGRVSHHFSLEQLKSDDFYRHLSKEATSN